MEANAQVDAAHLRLVCVDQSIVRCFDCLKGKVRDTLDVVRWLVHVQVGNAHERIPYCQAVKDGPPTSPSQQVRVRTNGLHFEEIVHPNQVIQPAWHLSERC